VKCVYLEVVTLDKGFDLITGQGPEFFMQHHLLKMSRTVPIGCRPQLITPMLLCKDLDSQAVASVQLLLQELAASFSHTLETRIIQIFIYRVHTQKLRQNSRPFPDFSRPTF
jgi:hypothetical protein